MSEEESARRPGAEDPPASVYELLGGTSAFCRIVDAFYARVEKDAILRPVYPRSLHCARNNLSAFLARFFGEPSATLPYVSGSSLRAAHARFRIGPAEREAWLANMRAALDEAGIEEPALGAMRRFFEESSTFLINCPGHGTEAHAPAASHPAAGSVGQDWISSDVTRRWAELKVVEELIAACGRGDSARVLALAESDPVRSFTYHRQPALLSILACMGCSGDGELFEYVARRLEADPALAAAPHSGTRTLLHAAAGAWNVPFVELLLQLGADPNALDAAGHAPLYAAGNRLVRPERRHSDAGSRVVAALVEAGADVNACDGAKRCTALHMAARRGNVAIAAALLDHHADIEACDSLGETPLRRAVNCGQPAMVALLLSRGADAHAKGSRGLTPLQAARTPAIKALFRRHTAGS